MHDVQKQARILLERQCRDQSSDPLNDIRKEAVSHVLTRVLDADGFTVLIVSTSKEKTHGVALAGGTFPFPATLRELLSAVEGWARQFGVELELTVKGTAHPAGQVENVPPILH